MTIASNQYIPGAFTERAFRDIPTLRASFGRYKIIDIRTAAEQFYLSRTDWDAQQLLTMFDIVMPPFPGCIFEFQAGDRQFFSDEDSEPLQFQDTAVVFTTRPLSVEDKLNLGSDLPLDAHWSVRVTWIVSKDGNLGTYSDQPWFYLKRDGSLVKKNGLILATAENRPAFSTVMLAAIAPVLFALTLMHCQNVTLERVTTPLPLAMNNSKRRKQIEGRKKHPTFERHTVVIRDRKGRVISTGLTRQQPGSKRLHWVRGHFSTYTEFAPLFGRIVGRFWISAHMSGLVSEGVIDSDYRLEAA